MAAIKYYNPIAVDAGTTTNPGVAIGDTNSGWYRVSSGVIGLVISGTEVYRLGNNQHVINFNTNAIGTAPTNSNATIAVHAPDATQGTYSMATYGALPVFLGRRAEGTAAALSATTSSINLFALENQGYEGTTPGFTAARAHQVVTSTESYTSAAQGFLQDFFVVANGTTATSRALRLDQNGAVMIGTTTNDGGSKLQVVGRSYVSNSTTGASVSTFAQFNTGGNQPYLQLHGVANQDGAGAALACWTNTANNAPILRLAKSKGNTISTYTAVAAADTLGYITFEGTDGAAFFRAAEIKAIVDNGTTVSTGIVPGSLQFGTADATGTMQIAGVIDSFQCWLPGTGGTVSSNRTWTSASAVQPPVQVLSTSASAALAIGRFNSTATAAPFLILGKSNGAINVMTAVAATHQVGILSGQGADGTNMVEAARITFMVDNGATVSTGIVPGSILFTTANSAGTLTRAGMFDSNQCFIVSTFTTTSAITGFTGGTLTPKLQVNSNNNANGAAVAITQWRNTQTDLAQLVFAKGRATTPGTYTAIISGDSLGQIHAQGADGTNLSSAARLLFLTEGTITTGQVPGVVQLWTTSGAGVNTIGWQVNSAQRMTIGATTDDTVNRLQVNGGISAAVGSAGAPSYTFAGDLTTGIFRQSASNIGVAVGGVERTRFASAGGYVASRNVAIASLANAFTGGGIVLHGADASASQIDIVSYGSQSYLIAYAMGGTGVSPTATTTSQSLNIELRGYDGTATTNGPGARIQLIPTETWSSTARGAKMIFQVVANTTTTTLSAIAINNSGRVTIGGVTDNGTDALQVIGSLSISTALAAQYGGTGFASYAVGDTLYASGTTALSKLSGNTTTTKKWMSQTGTGSASQAPTWDTLAESDLPVLVSGKSRAFMLMGG